MSDAANRNGATSIKPAMAKFDYQGNRTAVLQPAGGLTKREHFAAMAMQGYCAGTPTADTSSIVSWSVKAADALLLALEKK